MLCWEKELGLAKKAWSQGQEELPSATSHCVAWLLFICFWAFQMAGVENTHHKGCYDAKLCMWSISTSPWACCYRVTSGQGELLVSLITGIEELGWSKGHMAAPKSKIPQASSPSHSVSVVMMCYMWKKIPPWRRWGRSKQHFCLA